MQPFLGKRARKKTPLGAFSVERAKGIEPSYSAWEADVLPLNYICIGCAIYSSENTAHRRKV